MSLSTAVNYLITVDTQGLYYLPKFVEDTEVYMEVIDEDFRDGSARLMTITELKDGY
jgi:hypothetical protein